MRKQKIVSMATFAFLRKPGEKKFLQYYYNAKSFAFQLENGQTSDLQDHSFPAVDLNAMLIYYLRVQTMGTFFKG